MHICLVYQTQLKRRKTMQPQEGGNAVKIDQGSKKLCTNYVIQYDACY